MKYIFAFILAISPGMYAVSKDIKVLKIDIELNNLPNGVRFHLLRKGMAGGVDTLNSMISRNGKVQLITEEVTSGEMVFVNFEDFVPGTIKKSAPTVKFFIDNTVIHIKGDMKSWPQVKIEGSKATDVFDTYHKTKEPVLKKVNDALAEMDSQKNRDSTALKPLLAEYRLLALNYFRKNINVLSTPYMIDKSFPLTPEDKKQLFLEMNAETKESFFAKELARKLQFDNKPYAVLAETVRIDNVLPDLKLESEDGSIVSLKQLATKGEYTLIDFWAYWCGPCRDAIPEIKAVYKKYKDRGFNVIGVSVDPNESKWAKALGELDTEWTNVIDRDKISQKVFSISGIPAYILVNKKAEIIAMDVFGNKYNGASDRFFSEKDKVMLSGKSIGEIIEKLISGNSSKE